MHSKWLFTFLFLSCLIYTDRLFWHEKHDKIIGRKLYDVTFNTIANEALKTSSCLDLDLFHPWLKNIFDVKNIKEQLVWFIRKNYVFYLSCKLKTSSSFGSWKKLFARVLFNSLQMKLSKLHSFWSCFPLLWCAIKENFRLEYHDEMISKCFVSIIW